MLLWTKYHQQVGRWGDFWGAGRMPQRGAGQLLEFGSYPWIYANSRVFFKKILNILPIRLAEEGCNSQKPGYFKPREWHGVTLELEGAQRICNIDIRAPGSLLRFLSNGWETLSLHHNASGFMLILSASIHSQFSGLLLLLFLTKLGVVV